MINEPRNNNIDVDNTPEGEIKKLIVVDKSVEKDKGKGKVVKPVLKTIQRPPHHFFSYIKEN